MSNLLLNVQKEVHSLVANKTLRLVAWKVSENSLLIQHYQNRLPVLSTVPEGQVQSQITTCPKEKWVARKENDPVQCSVFFF